MRQHSIYKGKEVFFANKCILDIHFSNYNNRCVLKKSALCSSISGILKNR